MGGSFKDEYREAIESGKTHKKWITEKDNRVRETHKEVSDKVIPIGDFYRVGLARMRFPKDYEYASVFPEETVNCRFTIEYLNDKFEIKKKNNTSWIGKPAENDKQIIQRLTEYGISKKIILDKSFTHFDGDTELVKEFIDEYSKQIHGYNTRYPNKVARLAVSYSLDDSTYAQTDGLTVFINGYAYRDKELLKKDYVKQVKQRFFTQGSTYKDIPVHEAAHIIVNREQLKRAGLIENVVNKNKLLAVKEISKEISTYAAASDNEIIAEAYVMYKNGYRTEKVLNVLSYCGTL